MYTATTRGNSATRLRTIPVLPLFGRFEYMCGVKSALPLCEFTSLFPPAVQNTNAMCTMQLTTVWEAAARHEVH